MTAPTPASLSTVALRRIVAGLDRGDRVRVTFTDGHVEVGTLRKSGLSVLDPSDPAVANRLHLAVGSHRMIRNSEGLPGSGIESVEPWDDDARFDRLLEDAQTFLAYQRDAELAHQCDRERLQEKADTAKAKFIAEWLRGEVR